MQRLRVIPILLLKEGGLVKPKAFKCPIYLGDPINAVKIFNDKMADELIILDVDATARGDVNFNWIEEIVSEAFMPIAYGGGLKTVEQCAKVISLGVEKVVINTSVIEQPGLIEDLANQFGSQAVVVSIDARNDWLGRCRAFTRRAKKRSTYSPAILAAECERCGAGEILITDVSREGSYSGFNLELVEDVSSSVSIPVIAHGGAAGLSDFVLAVNKAKASAVAAGSLFAFSSPRSGVLINYPSQELLHREFWRKLDSGFDTKP